MEEGGAGERRAMLRARCWSACPDRLLAPPANRPSARVPAQEPFHARQEVGRLRLLALLQRCMIRASKAELISLGIPPLVCKV